MSLSSWRSALVFCCPIGRSVVVICKAELFRTGRCRYSSCVSALERRGRVCGSSSWEGCYLTCLCFVCCDKQKPLDKLCALLHSQLFQVVIRLSRLTGRLLRDAVMAYFRIMSAWRGEWPQNMSAVTVSEPRIKSPGYEL